MMQQDIRWQQRFDNYQKALALLENIDQTLDQYDDIAILASIQAFEMVLELGWNLLKDRMQADGLHFMPAPKPVIREAFNKGYLDNAQVWMDAINDRNLTSHSYNKEVASQLISNIHSHFLPAFISLREACARQLQETSHGS